LYLLRSAIDSQLSHFEAYVVKQTRTSLENPTNQRCEASLVLVHLQLSGVFSEAKGERRGFLHGKPRQGYLFKLKDWIVAKGAFIVVCGKMFHSAMYIFIIVLLTNGACLSFWYNAPCMCLLHFVPADNKERKQNSEPIYRRKEYTRKICKVD
jgi:hypothetical protein